MSSYKNNVDDDQLPPPLIPYNRKKGIEVAPLVSPTAKNIG